MSKKDKIIHFLECAYSGAKQNDDLEMMCRISRAIIAFSYDNLVCIPNWDDMLNSYLMKD